MNAAAEKRQYNKSEFSFSEKCESDFSNGLVAPLTLPALSLSQELPVQVAERERPPLWVQPADPLTHQEKGGNNERMDAFILMKGIKC